MNRILGTPLMMSLMKSRNPKPKVVFSLETRRLAKFFDGLKSSQHNWQRSYTLGKATKYCLRWANFKVRTYRTLAAKVLTCLLLVYEYIILWNHTLSRHFWATLQLHNSPVDCAKELFKLLKDLVVF